MHKYILAYTSLNADVLAAPSDLEKRIKKWTYHAFFQIFSMDDRGLGGRRSNDETRLCIEVAVTTIKSPNNIASDKVRSLAASALRLL